ncbi:uncharacterized protein LOC144058333 [Vanacampus margaritifer]
MTSLKATWRLHNRTKSQPFKPKRYNKPNIHARTLLQQGVKGNPWRTFGPLQVSRKSFRRVFVLVVLAGRPRETKTKVKQNDRQQVWATYGLTEVELANSSFGEKFESGSGCLCTFAGWLAIEWSSPASFPRLPPPTQGKRLRPSQEDFAPTCRPVVGLHVLTFSSSPFLSSSRRPQDGVHDQLVPSPRTRSLAILSASIPSCLSSSCCHLNVNGKSLIAKAFPDERASFVAGRLSRSSPVDEDAVASCRLVLPSRPARRLRP